MPPHTFSPDCACPACWNALNVTLCELRDSLVQLSLGLKDLQFEYDIERRECCERTVENLLRDIAAGYPPGPSAGQSRSGD